MIKVRVLKTETTEVYKNGIYGAEYYDSDKLQITHYFDGETKSYKPLKFAANIYNKDVETLK